MDEMTSHTSKGSIFLHQVYLFAQPRYCQAKLVELDDREHMESVWIPKNIQQKRNGRLEKLHHWMNRSTCPEHL